MSTGYMLGCADHPKLAGRGRNQIELKISLTDGTEVGSRPLRQLRIELPTGQSCNVVSLSTVKFKLTSDKNFIIFNEYMFILVKIITSKFAQRHNYIWVKSFIISTYGSGFL